MVSVSFFLGILNVGFIQSPKGRV